MISYVVMALGALTVTLAGLMGGMPSPWIRSSASDETLPTEPDIDVTARNPASDGITPPPHLPPEILAALAEGQRLGRAISRPSQNGKDVRGPVPGKFEDEPTA